MLGKHNPQRIARNITMMAPPNCLISEIAETALPLMVTKGRVPLLTSKRKQSLPIRKSKRQKDSSSMLGCFLRRARGSTTTPLVAAGQIWIVNGIMGAVMHV